MNINTNAENVPMPREPADGKYYSKHKPYDILDDFASASSSRTILYDENWMSTHDILDLQRMAEARVQAHMERIEKQFDESRLRKNTMVGKASYEEIKRNDAVLKQAYETYYNPALHKYPHLVKETVDLINDLENMPHLYCPYEREETTEDHVTRWLENHTSNPEAELLGFTSRDPYEPKRYIPTEEPRLSTSDTNVVLGKRKRSRDEDDLVCVGKSSSESRLVYDDGSYGYRPKKTPRRR